MAAELEAFRQNLTRLQALLYAAHKHSLLIVLQAMDAGGKDGTVNHVFAAFNAQGTTVTGSSSPHRSSATTTSSGGCIRMCRPKGFAYPSLRLLRNYRRRPAMECQDILYSGCADHRQNCLARHDRPITLLRSEIEF